MNVNRRGFLGRILGGAATVVVAPVVVEAGPKRGVPRAPKKTPKPLESEIIVWDNVKKEFHATTIGAGTNRRTVQTYRMDAKGNWYTND